MICEVILNGPEYCMDCAVCKREHVYTVKCKCCGIEVKESDAVDEQCKECYASELEYNNKYLP